MTLKRLKKCMQICNNYHQNMPLKKSNMTLYNFIVNLKYTQQFSLLEKYKSIVKTINNQLITLCK